MKLKRILPKVNAKVNPRILCLVPCLPEDLNPECLTSILSQTIPVEMIVFLPKRLQGGTLSARVSTILNDALQHIRLENFQFMLRVDCDACLPRDYVESALNGKYDLYGVGFSMMINTESFKSAMQSKFNQDSDDSFILYKFTSESLKVESGNPNVTTRKHFHCKTECLNYGRIQYKIGFEPFHILAFLRHPTPSIIYMVTGYVISMIKKESKFDFAPKIWNHQIQRLRGLLHASKSMP